MLGITSDTIVDCQNAHDLAINRLAATRFNLDGWNVKTNTCSKPGYIYESATPDIIAESHDKIVAIGEVETLETLSPERALQWKSFGESCVRFYIYVPEGAEMIASRLIAEHKVECAGLRCYSLNGKADVRQIHLDLQNCPTDDHPWWISIGSSDNSCT